MVRVGKAVGACASRGHDCGFLKGEHGVARARGNEHIGDRFRPFCVRDRVSTPIEHGERRSLASRDLGDELRAAERRRAELEMRCTRPRQRAAAEEGAAKVGGTATCARDDSPGRMFERREPLRQHSRLVQDLECTIVPCDVQLVPRRTLERVLPVRADLRRHAEVPQEAEGTARDGGVGDVEMHGDPPASLQMDAARGVEQAGELCQPVAVAPRGDRRQLVPKVVRERHPRAPEGGVCSRRRDCRTHRVRLPRRRDGTAGSAGTCYARRRFRRRVGR